MHLSLNNPGIETPDLRVSDMTHNGSDGSSARQDLAPAMGVAYLEFRSAYNGTHAMVEGAVRGVAAALCESDISMQLLRGGSSAGETGVRKTRVTHQIAHVNNLLNHVIILSSISSIILSGLSDNLPAAARINVIRFCHFIKKRTLCAFIRPVFHTVPVPFHFRSELQTESGWTFFIV